jgi:hypothetical protein
LKTKCLLGDVSNPRGTQAFAIPATLDPEAMKYVGAVAFHSWGGAKPEQYAAWGDLAERLKLPLIVSEAGFDAAAWEKGAFRSFDNAIGEMAIYQQLLLYARPQNIVYWEYTGDYSLLSGDRTLPLSAATERFSLQKHWSILTPPNADVLGSSSDTDGILATAFRSAVGSPVQYTIHLANPLWDRPVILNGLPPEIASLNVVRTSKGQFFQKLEPLPVREGKLTLMLPRESLTTLTTIQIPSPDQ